MATETEKPAMGEETTETKIVEAPAAKSSEDLQAELDRTAAALKKANDEAKKHRLRKEELERAEEERSQAKLSEEERTKRASEEQARKVKETEAEVAKLRDENQRLRVDGLVKDEARKKDFKYPELVPGLIDRSRITIDEDGKIEGVDKVVERLAKDYPDLLNAPSGGGSPQAIRTRQSGPGGTIPTGRNQDPYLQELVEMGRGGRM